MSLLLCRKSRVIVPNFRVSLINSSTHLGFTQNHLAFAIRLLSSYPEENQRSYVVSYLINSCGLTPESAKSVSSRVYFQTPDRPDSVLRLLKDYGFTNDHASRLIKKDVRLLVANPETILLPKLEFLCSLGISRSDLPEILCYNSDLLFRSLHNHLIPTYNMLKSILGSDEEVVQSLKRSYMFCMSKKLATNVAFLRKLEIPQKIICYLLTRSPNVLCVDPSKFSEIVNKVSELGFNPSKYTFMHAVQLISQTSHKTWQQKMKVYRSWGLSEDEIWLAIRKYPFCMFISVKKLESIMEFLVNKMGYRPADVVGFPVIFGYSLEKRIIPRFSVIRVLQLKGLLKADISIASVVVFTDKRFLDTYVIKNHGEIPQLLSIYRGEMSIQELGYEFEAEKHVAS